MTPSTFIARIMGPALVIIGLGLLLQTGAFRALASDFLRSAGLIYFSGLIAVVVGLVILNVHNLWVRDWRVIITLFGWFALIGGIFRLLATTFVQNAGLEAMTRPRALIVAAVGQLVLGGYLTIMGYRDMWEAGSHAKGHKPSNAAVAKAGTRPAKRAQKHA